jgi:hypothetical protein
MADWMDELAAGRSKRITENAEKETHEQERLREIRTALDRQLPALKSRLGRAAEALTKRFKEKLGFGAELACFNDPSVHGQIRVTWSRQANPTELAMSASREKMLFNVTVEPDCCDVPSVALRLVDGELRIQVNGETMDPEKAAEEVLKPFFRYLAES